MAPYELPSIPDVQSAVDLIIDKALGTEVYTSRYLTRLARQNIAVTRGEQRSDAAIQLFFKCEHLQKTGSFKFRGAVHFLTKRENHELSQGVVAYSTGNHALAVAHAAQLISKERNILIPTYVVVPSNCPLKKVQTARSYGAIVYFSGNGPEERALLADKIQKSTGGVLVPPADHRDIVLGQATLVHEFLQQVSCMGHSLDAILVPSGGGGLLVGAIATCKPLGVAVFGTEPACGGPGLALAMESGQRSLQVDGPPSIADGLRSLTGEANWEHIRQPGNVAQMFTAGEEEIRSALRLAARELGFVIEPSAAVPLAVALFNAEFARHMASMTRPPRVGIVLTGGNIGEEHFYSIVSE